MYSAAVNPISEDLLKAMMQPVLPTQPAMTQVSMPQMPMTFQGQQQGSGDIFGGGGAKIGEALGKANPSAPADPNAPAEPGMFANMWQSLAPTHSITQQQHTPLAPPSPNAAPTLPGPIALPPGAAPASTDAMGSLSQMLPGVAPAATDVATTGATAGVGDAVVPGLGVAANLAQGKKGAAAGGALGIGAGVALAPFTGGLSLVAAPLIGSMLGGMADKKKAA